MMKCFKNKFMWIFLFILLSGFGYYFLWSRSNINPDRVEYKVGVIDLGLAFTAKAFCSCIFVTEMDEKYCLEYASIDQVSPDLTVDRKNKTTQSKLFKYLTAEAKFIDSNKGCVLQ